MNKKQTKANENKMDGNKSGSYPSRAKIKITNMVFTVDLKREIDIERMEREFKEVQYESGTFPGIVLNHNNPECSIRFFKNGKVIITGLTKRKDSQLILDKIIRGLKKMDIIIEETPPIELQNIVVSVDFGYPIDIQRASAILEGAHYDPETFPGLRYRPQLDGQNTSVTFLIFSSGKCILTGAKSEKEVEFHIKSLGRILRDNDLFL